MRVVQAVPFISPRQGGPAHATVGLSRALSARGLDVEVVSTRAGLDEQAEAELRARLGGEATLTLVDVIGPAHLGLAPRWHAALGGALARAELAHLHTVFPFPSLVAPSLCRAAGVPQVLRPAGMLDAAARSARSRGRKALALALLGRRDLRRAEAVQATSECEAAELRALEPRALVHVLPLGVELEAPPSTLPAGATVEGPLASAAPPPGVASVAGRVGYLGRLHPIKQLELLIDALARLPPQVELHLAGAGDPAYLGRLRARALARGVASRVVFVGHLNEQAKRTFLAGCQVLACASRHENFGVAVVEALAAGRPVVVTPEVALGAEVVAAGAGLCVPARAEAFSGALAALLGDPARRLAQGRAARALAARYAWEPVAAQTLALYRSVLAGCGRARA